MSVNKVILLGNLGKDPEVRYLDNNKVVAQFSLATSETFLDRNGEKKVDTEWHNIEMWDNLAKTAEKYLKKGSQVYIEGKIKTESWRDKEGNERTGKKIRATSMTLLGGAPRGTDHTENKPASTMGEDSKTPLDSGSSNSTDDLPF
jgi:single-strand DNA-binding protein